MGSRYIVGTPLRASFHSAPHTFCGRKEYTAWPHTPRPGHCGIQERAAKATLDTISRAWEARTEAHWGLLLGF